MIVRSHISGNVAANWMDYILKHAPNMRLGQITKIKSIIHNCIAQKVFLQEKKNDEMATMKNVIHKYLVVS